MLPNYLLYFLGVDDNDQSSRSSIQHSLRIGLSVSGGFLVVFLVVGVISRVFTQWIEQNAKYAALVIGVALVVAGIKMFSGWKPGFLTPKSTHSLDRTTKSMFVYGLLYAIASIGCTIGFLTTAIFGSFSTHGVISGIVSVVLYGLGMSLLVTALTVSLGLARRGLVTSIRGVLPYITRASALLTVLTGLYLTWYWFVAITERRSLGPLASRVESAQTRLTTLLQDVGARGLGVILGGIIITALLYGRQRRGNEPTS